VRFPVGMAPQRSPDTCLDLLRFDSWPDFDVVDDA